jgi:hypothetical protein
MLSSQICIRGSMRFIHSNNTFDQLGINFFLTFKYSEQEWI